MLHITNLTNATQGVPGRVRRRRTPTWLDRFIAVEGVFVMPLGIAHSEYQIHKLTELVETLASSTAAALGNITEELTDLRVVVIQNRLALDIILARASGVCQVIHQECYVYIPDNSGNVRKAIGEIKKVEEGARKVADVTDVGGILNDIAAWFRGWGAWLIEVLVVGIVGLITLCVLIRVCPSCLTMLMKKMCQKDTEHHCKRRHEEEARKDDAIEMTPVHHDI
ncbi:hypothetical protein NDU88_005374 [Pleurodeles waltl]|uniref:Envelope glycoprotein n=1 Tax=Pleurodeles waltl TaxID=8319 RepID=A0AAV7RN40_PLEWA|nr:hypothetical protein NDU88_005374 [Pleurodeles waltl]